MRDDRGRLLKRYRFVQVKQEDGRPRLRVPSVGSFLIENESDGLHFYVLNKSKATTEILTTVDLTRCN